MIVAVPIPKTKEAEAQKVEKAITQSLQEAKKRNIIGKEVTPFLLQRINELTKGESLKSSKKAPFTR